MHLLFYECRLTLAQSTIKVFSVCFSFNQHLVVLTGIRVYTTTIHHRCILYGLRADRQSERAENVPKQVQLPSPLGEDKAFSAKLTGVLNESFSQ